MITDLLIGGIGGIISKVLSPYRANQITKQNRFIPNSTLKDVYKEGLRHFGKEMELIALEYSLSYLLIMLYFVKLKNMLKSIFQTKTY